MKFIVSYHTTCMQTTTHTSGKATGTPLMPVDHRYQYHHYH